MREPAPVRLLSALLPPDVRAEVFTPSACDLAIERLERTAAARTAAGRAVAGAAYTAALLVLVVRCGRLAVSDAAARRRHRQRLTPIQPGEPFSMLLYNIRHAVRLLGRERAFTATAVLTLALGVGANVAIFAVAQAVMLRPLPYDRAGDLVILNHRDQRTGLTKEFIAIGDYVDLRVRQDVFDALGSYGGGGVTVNGHGDPFRATLLSATPGLLEALRIAPAAGRGLEPDDSRPGAAPVAMIGYTMWQDRFGGDTRAIGRTLDLGMLRPQIVGVAPPGFRFPAAAPTDIIVAAPLPVSAPANRKEGWVFALARLRPGVDVRQANARLAALSKDMETAHPESNAGSLYYAVPLRDQWLGDAKRPLVLLLVAVAIVLLIACANVGNLLLARALTRRQEMAVRAALGADRRHLLAQLATESLALTLVSGGAGLVIAYWGVPALVALVPAGVSIPGLADVGIDATVFAYTLGLSAAAAVIFAALSGLAAGRETGSAVLVSQSRVSGGRAVRRTTSALIVAEVALAVVLLVGAGLIVRTFAALLSTDPGFDPDRVAVMQVSLPGGRYQTSPARRAFYDRAFAALGEIPGVVTVGAAAVVPLTGNNWTVGFERADRPVPAGTRPPDVGWQSASGGYFKALGIPLRSGRYFGPADTPDSPPVVIVSSAVEKQFFEGTSAVGRKVKIGDGDAEIVGVVGDIRRGGLTEEPRADLYFPFERGATGVTTLFIKASSEPSHLLPAIQTVLRGLEPQILFGEMRTMNDVAAESIASTRFVLWLLGIFAFVALALAAVGVYGVMSYVVRQRTREFGTRVALGATPADIVWLVMREGSAITSIGLLLGVGGGLVLARAMESILYGVSAHDPATLLTALGTLTAATATACYLPARRAMRLNAARTLSGL